MNPNVYDSVEFGVTLALFSCLLLFILGVAFHAVWDLAYRMGRESRRSVFDSQERQIEGWKQACSALGDPNDDLKFHNGRLALELQEARDMARKPLTEEQLGKCKAALGRECPRCGNEDADDIEFGDLETDESDPGGAIQEVTCGDCGEKWVVWYRVERVLEAKG